MYAATFPLEERGGHDAARARMALGTLLIKERYQFSEEDIVEEIVCHGDGSFGTNWLLGYQTITKLAITWAFA